MYSLSWGLGHAMAPGIAAAAFTIGAGGPWWVGIVLAGGAIALVSCHHGFHCDHGAEGVGRAATNAFVHSFVLILVLDLFMPGSDGFEVLRRLRARRTATLVLMTALAVFVAWAHRSNFARMRATMTSVGVT